MTSAFTLSKSQPALAQPGFNTDRLRLLRAWYSRWGALGGYLLAAVVIWIGWLGRAERNIDAGHGVGYLLGIAGGSLMLLLLLYSLRKRASWLRRLGATRHWFRGHMMLGIAGPVLILYHCNFSLGDLNSRVALFCTLLVAASGLVGRYLYAGFHKGLYGSRATLQELVEDMQRSAAHDAGSSALVADVRARLAELDQQVLASADGVVQATRRHLAISWETRRMRRQLLSLVRRRLIARAMTSPAVDAHADELEQAMRRYLSEHLRRVRRVARFTAFERLFSLWHVIHVPFFLMMMIAAVVHVLAVHLY